MTITKRFIQYTDYPLIDRLIVEGDNYWGIDTNKNLIHNDKVVTKLSDETIDGITLDCSYFCGVYFCRFGTEEFLLVDISNENEGTDINAWIISENGEIKTCFSVDKRATKIHVQKEKIIVAYSVCTDKMSFAVLDRHGNTLKEFHPSINSNIGVDIVAICQKNENELFMRCYYPDEFSTLNLDTYELINYTPHCEDPCRVLTYKEDYLYSGLINDNIDYASKDFDIRTHTISIYRMKLSELDKTILSKEYLGEVPCVPFITQSLPNGQLLFTDTRGQMSTDGKASYWVVEF